MGMHNYEWRDAGNVDFAVYEDGPFLIRKYVQGVGTVIVREGEPDGHYVDRAHEISEKLEGLSISEKEVSSWARTLK